MKEIVHELKLTLICRIIVIHLLNNIVFWHGELSRYEWFIWIKSGPLAFKLCQQHFSAIMMIESHQASFGSVSLYQDWSLSQNIKVHWPIEHPRHWFSMVPDPVVTWDVVYILANDKLSMHHSQGRIPSLIIVKHVFILTAVLLFSVHNAHCVYYHQNINIFPSKKKL